jgi:RNA polymerase sigma factor (sigma-70 family)
MGANMGDSESLNLDCLLRHSDWLTALARRLVAPGMAEDLVQDTWLAALRNPPYGVRSPRAWLSRVARRLARLRYDSRGALQDPSASREGFPPTDEVVARIEQERLLARLVVELEEPYRRVLLQRFYSGLTAARISRIEGVPAATVRTRSRRALALLRERLDREHGGDRRGWPLASLFLVPKAEAFVGVGKGALLMGTKTIVTLSVASGVLCTLAVTDGILPRLAEPALAGAASIVSTAPHALAPAAISGSSAEKSESPDSGFAPVASSARRPVEWPVEGAVSTEDLRKLLLSSDRIEQVRAIKRLVAEGSVEANQVLLDAFFSTSDHVLLALLEEALLEPSLDVAPAVMQAYLASDDPELLGRLGGLLSRLASARPELKAEVIGHFLGALDDSAQSPERASAATDALASLGIDALDELAHYLVERDSGPEGVGSAAWLIARLPEQYGELVREKLAEGLRGSLDSLSDPNLSQEEREAVLQKTGSLAWSTSLRPEQEHDRLGEILLEGLLATRDSNQAGSLAWGLGNLKGLSEPSRIGAARSLLDALNGQADDSLRQQYLHTVQQLAVAQPPGPRFDELVRLIQDARSMQEENGPLASRLDGLLAELRSREENANR